MHIHVMLILYSYKMYVTVNILINNVDVNLSLQLDVIIVDLDGGSVRIPECVIIPSISEDILVRMKQALTMVSALEDSGTEIDNVDDCLQ